jgi:hexosaminidase
VIPEIGMPGHSSAALAAYPYELSCTGKCIYDYTVGGLQNTYEGDYFVMPGHYWPNNNVFNVCNKQTYHFLYDVLNRVADLFPDSEFIHIGGDEVETRDWETCKDCGYLIDKAKDDDLASVNDLHFYFIDQIETILKARGKRLIGWDEVFWDNIRKVENVKLDKNTSGKTGSVVMVWRSELELGEVNEDSPEVDPSVDIGRIAAEAGHDVVISPTAYCYLDFRQFEDKDKEPVAIPDPPPPDDPDKEPKKKLSTLENVYAFDPIPVGLAEEKHKYIRGAQGNLWTE